MEPSEIETEINTFNVFIGCLGAETVECILI